MKGGKPYTMERFALYMEHLIRARKARSTIARYIAAIRSALLLAERKDLITWTPPPRPPFPPAYQDTAKGNLEQLDRSLKELALKTEPMAVRDYAMVVLMGKMGLRPREITGLELKELSVERAEITVRRVDGRTPDVARLMPEAIEALMRWLMVRGDWPGPLFAAFTTSKIERCAVSNRTIGRIVRRYQLDSPRALRHMAITSYLERTGGDLAGAQELGRLHRASTVRTYELNRQQSRDPAK